MATKAFTKPYEPNQNQVMFHSPFTQCKIQIIIKLCDQIILFDNSTNGLRAYHNQRQNHLICGSTMTPSLNKHYYAPICTQP